MLAGLVIGLPLGTLIGVLIMGLLKCGDDRYLPDNRKWAYPYGAGDGMNPSAPESLLMPKPVRIPQSKG